MRDLVVFFNFIYAVDHTAMELLKGVRSMQETVRKAKSHVGVLDCCEPLARWCSGVFEDPYGCLVSTLKVFSHYWLTMGAILTLIGPMADHCW